jgi:hypothetical protein
VDDEVSIRFLDRPGFSIATISSSRPRSLSATQLSVVSPVSGSAVMVAAVMAITKYADFLPTRCLRDPRVNRIGFTAILCQAQSLSARHNEIFRPSRITRVTAELGRPYAELS